MTMRPEYPPRPPFFAMKFTRLIFDVGAFPDIGPERFAFLSYVAQHEDRLHYKVAPEIWSSEFERVFGVDRATVYRWIRSLKTMGWLVHIKESKRAKPGLWVDIPERYRHLLGHYVAPVQHNEAADIRCTDATKTVHKPCIKRAPSYPNPNPIPKDICAASSDVASATGPADRSPPLFPNEKSDPFEFNGQSKPGRRKSASPKSASGKPSNNAKHPKRARSRAPAPPTVEEVAARIAERGLNIDSEEFYAYYQARGWTLNRGQPVKDWDACLTTWAKRQPKFESAGYANGRNVAFAAPKQESFKEY